MSPIKDVSVYLSDMQHSLVDKLFFAGVIHPNMLVDYGCADGALLRAYNRMFPSTELIGYDHDIAMTVQARDESPEKIKYWTNWADVSIQAEKYGGDVALNLSSVLHEIYSYQSEEDIEYFYEEVFASPFKFVVVRDMMVSESIIRAADPLDVAKVYQFLGSWKVKQWESKWGPITQQKSLVHLLLTYTYVDNWKREMAEDYLPIPVEHFMETVPRNYRPIHFEHYTLPYLRRRVMSDMGISLSDRTHVKIIFERVRS